MLAGVHAPFGFAALSVLCAIAVAATLALVGWRASGWSLVSLAALAFVLREAASPRAQLFSHRALRRDARDRARRGSPRYLWLCVPDPARVDAAPRGRSRSASRCVAVGFLVQALASRRRAAVLVAVCTGNMRRAVWCPEGPRALLGRSHHAAVHPRVGAAVARAGSAHSRRPSGSSVALVLVAAWVVGAASVQARRDVILLALFTLVAVRYVRFTVGGGDRRDGAPRAPRGSTAPPRPARGARAVRRALATRRIREIGARPRRHAASRSAR